MSQLPELEVLRRDLERDVAGKRIKDVTLRGAALLARPGDEREFSELLTGQRVSAVTRHGMHLVFQLDEDRAMVVRLGRQGSLSRETAAAQGSRHTRLIARFTTGGALHYTDAGDDGELSIVSTAELASLPELGKLGIDPLADTFTWRAFGQELVRRNAALKTILLDSSFVVGLGDLYSDEVLWAAGLSGHRLSGTLSSQEIRRLYRSLLEVLHEAVKQRTSDGLPAPQSEEDEDEDVSESWLKVWGREGLPCARCRQPIRYAEVVDGAMSYHCGSCQT